MIFNILAEEVMKLRGVLDEQIEVRAKGAMAGGRCSDKSGSYDSCDEREERAVNSSHKPEATFIFPFQARHARV